MTALRRPGLVAARKAAGHTQESLASTLYIDRKTVIRWEAGDSAPWPYMWPKLARLLGLTTDQLQALFAPAEVPSAYAADGLEFTFHWIDQCAGWSPGTARRKVAARVARLDARRLGERNRERAKVGRRELMQRLAEYYADGPAGSALYERNVAGHRIGTSVLTRPEWLDLGCPLTADGDRLTAGDVVPRELPALDSFAARAAVERLAEASVLGVRLSDAQLYRLLAVDVRRDAAAGTVGLVPFVEYALTADLLEGELLDAAGQHGELPLRDRYLPDLASVLDMSGRACAGGVLSLCAVARPADANRPAPDYALLVQKRSDQVLNAPGRLAVIPKGFHQPLIDRRADARMGATLRRELEEELFARTEVDNTLGENRVADPMHPARLSEPMRWLDESGALRMECTGFGLNLVSGNYEFACLTVIEDETFWRRFGGSIEANWEAAGLRTYSSLDSSAITDLVVDDSWSNEGLFAFLQGLRRLAELDGKRVDLPEIE